MLTQFLALARRLPTNSELFNWSTKIKASRPAAFDLAGSLLDASANADLGALVRLYQAYFKRSTDQAGYTYWTTRLRAGRPLDDV